MTLTQILALIIAAVFVIGVPAMIIFSIVDHLRGRGSERKGGSASAGIGAAMIELDRLMARPSAEHIVEAQNQTLMREDDQGGD
jgi:hypothetical protein